MRFAGLFVGVDRQLDPEIDALSYAGRDALAFWAAFADANAAEGHSDDEDTVVIVGEEATVGAVGTALDKLIAHTNGRHYDIVALHFSCHGTPDGRLILSDASAADLEATTLPIARISEALRDLKAGCVIGVFESCFSGLAAGCTTEGNDAALRATMEALAEGGNRAVVWAAGSAEYAWESPRLRHGLLTYALVVEGLYGTLGEREGSIDIARWINDAVYNAEQHAARDGRNQRPGRVIRLSATPLMPRFRPGLRRQKQLAEDQVLVVEADLTGLEHYGLSPEMLAAVKAGLSDGLLHDREPRLTDLQQRAIVPEGALAGKSLVISGPTSCGKTLVGELATLVTAGRRLKTAVLLPMRALAAEKWEDFDRRYGPLGLQAVRSYGGAGDNDPLVAKGHFDVGFFTYEKFWLLALTNARLLDSLALVVIDETHMIADAGRGHVVELILTLLKLRRSEGQPIQVLALSAALGDTRGFPEWLDASPVTETARPIPLTEAVVGPSGAAITRDSRQPGVRNNATVLAAPVPVTYYKDPHGTFARGYIAIALAREALSRGEQVLIFRDARWSVRLLARQLSQTLAMPACSRALDHLGEERPENDESRASSELRHCLSHGIGFHISDLERAEREAVESAFRAGALSILITTSGLAMGVNLPANVVIIADHERRKQRIPVAEYRNMAGRAGRWMGDITHGTSYLIATRNEHVSDLTGAFVYGEAEPLVSQLEKMRPEDLALVLMALDPTPLTQQQLLLRAAATFGGYQRRHDDVNRGAVDDALMAALERLVALGLVRQFAGTAGAGGNQALFELTPFGLICGREGLRAESAARVLRGAEIIRAAAEPLNEIALVALAQTTLELDVLYTPSENPETPDGQTELTGWHNSSQLTFRTQPALMQVLRESSTDDECYLRRLKRLNAISMWVRGKRLVEIEDAFTVYAPVWKGVEPAAGAIRSAAERSADVMRAVGRLVAERYPEEAEALRERVVVLLPRLEHGVIREAIKLMRLGLGIRRGAAIGLIGAGLATPELLFAALERDDPVLYPILTSDGVHRMRAALSRRPRTVWERAPDAAEASQRSLFDRIGDATAL
ncbi:MAG TPA: DEAD/DEAH box helicase [Gemmatimonadaceae bacterium]|jgi:replicative superfamily II helicase|nr:DEAD/DEAH box helicase [Gemmatimonadaceae bacterium]